MYPVRCRVTNVPMFLGEGQAPPPQTQHAMLEAQAKRQAAEAQARMKKIEGQMESSIKKEMIKTAASQANITIALAFIPYVGSILSLVASAIFAADAKKYKDLMEKAAKNAETTLKAEAAALEARMLARNEDVFREEMPVVHAELVNLATGNVQGRDGLHGLGFLKKARKELKRATDKVGKELQRPLDDAQRIGKEAQRSFDTIRGKAGYVALREKLEQMVRQAKIDMAEQEKTATALIGTDTHRAAVRDQIRINLMSDPEYRASLTELKQAAGHSPAAAGIATARAAADATGNRGTIMLVGGAALAAFMLLR